MRAGAAEAAFTEAAPFEKNPFAAAGVRAPRDPLIPAPRKLVSVCVFIRMCDCVGVCLCVCARAGGCVWAGGCVCGGGSCPVLSGDNTVALIFPRPQKSHPFFPPESFHPQKLSGCPYPIEAFR